MSKSSDKLPTGRALSFAAKHLGVDLSDISVIPVTGGYSLNRRAVVTANGRSVFVKEVDDSLLEGDGQQERSWLAKDHELTSVLRSKGFRSVASSSVLSEDKTILLLAACRAEDGWLWESPREEAVVNEYVCAVLGVADDLGGIQFSDDEQQRLGLVPYFRDKIAEHAPLPVLDDPMNRRRIVEKCNTLSTDSTSPGLRALREFVQSFSRQDAVKQIGSQLSQQPQDVFGHCDLRPDNLAYHPIKKELVLVDWNWASYAPAGFGKTEFLVSMARRGVDVSVWLDGVNVPLLAALIGFYLKGCLKPDLGEGSLLRDHQLLAAAAALQMLENSKSSVKT